MIKSCSRTKKKNTQAAMRPRAAQPPTILPTSVPVLIFPEAAAAALGVEVADVIAATMGDADSEGRSEMPELVAELVVEVTITLLDVLMGTFTCGEMITT